MNKLMTKQTTSSKPTALGDLRPFFHPGGVAVIGASPQPDNLGGQIIAGLQAQGYPGTVVAVHPAARRVGEASAVAQLDEVPEPVDLAIAAVSAQRVPGLIPELARRGIHHLIVISGGFAETGPEGAGLQKELQEQARGHGVRVIGPNGLGVFSAPARFNSFFLTPGQIRLPEAGPVALISQSGAFLSLMLDRLAERGLGVTYAVNFGNRVDVDESELLEAFAAVPDLRVIGMYLEGVADGRRFVETARRITQRLPVLVWKGGRQSRGQGAAFSHSASLAGSYPVFQAACARAGILQAGGLDSFFASLEALARQPVPRGPRTLVVSNGGGMGVYLTDLCETEGLTLPTPSGNLKQAVQGTVPSYFSLRNPIDLTGSGTNEQCVDLLERFAASGEFDLAVLVPLAGTVGITPELGAHLQSRGPLPVPLVCAAYSEAMLKGLRESVGRIGVPVYASAEEAVQAARTLVRRYQLTRKTERPAIQPHAYGRVAPPPPEERRSEPQEFDLKQWLGAAGVKVPPSLRVNQESDLEEAVQVLGFPLVLKRAEPGLRHKLENQALRLNLNSREALRAAWQSLSTRPGLVFAERQMPPGLDLLVGVVRDPDFGPVLVFGTGGSYVEEYQDVARTLLPAGPEALQELLEQTHAGRIACGLRGQAPLAIGHLTGFINLVSDWFLRDPEIQSLEFNPTRLYEDGLVVLDAKGVYSPETPA